MLNLALTALLALSGGASEAPASADAAVSTPAAPSPAQAILQIEANRLPASSLDPYVGHADPAVRARAARALGRLRTRDAAGSLARLVVDPDPSVRAEAAWALGRTPESGADILQRLGAERVPAVRAALLSSLGHEGTAAAVPPLLEGLRERPALLQRPLQAEAAAVALGRMHMRGVTAASSPEVIAALLDQLERLDRDARRGAAFALGRMAPKELPQPLIDAILDGARHDRDPAVRAFLVRATQNLEAAPRAALYADTAKDGEPAVRIATARAAGVARWPGVVDLLTDPVVGVRLEAIVAVGKQPDLDRVALLTPILQAGETLDAADAARSSGDPREVLGAAALTALADQIPLGPYLDPNRPTRVRAAAAAASSDKGRLVQLAVRDGEAAVRTAAASRLVELEPSRSEVLTLMDAFDPLVQGVAAEWLAEHPAAEAEARLLASIRAAKPTDIDTLQLDLKALAALYKSPLVRKPSADVAALVGPLRAHPDPLVAREADLLGRVIGLPPGPPPPTVAVPDLAAVHTLQGACIRTSRGEVYLRLTPDETPITVANFVRLAESGYFDGLSLHRVVPDFVVQDGDPRGDGWGGPGYTIPDELSPAHYREGTLGMALSGPDTGGSQWFITLSPQPHLDDGYTIFGEVTQGMPILKNLIPGDRIEKVTIERAPPAP